MSGAELERLVYSPSATWPQTVSREPPDLASVQFVGHPEVGPHCVELQASRVRLQDRGRETGFLETGPTGPQSAAQPGTVRLVTDARRSRRHLGLLSSCSHLLRMGGLLHPPVRAGPSAQSGLHRLNWLVRHRARRRFRGAPLPADPRHRDPPPVAVTKLQKFVNPSSANCLTSPARLLPHLFLDIVCHPETEGRESFPRTSFWGAGLRRNFGKTL